MCSCVSVHFCVCDVSIQLQFNEVFLFLRHTNDSLFGAYVEDVHLVTIPDWVTQHLPHCEAGRYNAYNVCTQNEQSTIERGGQEKQVHTMVLHGGKDSV